MAMERTILSSQGGGDMFAAKFTSAGALAWVRSYDLNDDTTHQGVGIALDPADMPGGIGSVYVVAREGDIWKLDTDGNTVWTDQDNSSLSLNDIAVDSDGYFYTVGDFLGTIETTDTITGDPITLTVADGSDYYYRDVYIGRYNSDGLVDWAQRAGGTRGDEGRGIAVDDAGHVYMTGHFWDTADFGDDILTATPTEGQRGASKHWTRPADVFISQLDATDGSFLWTSQAGGGGSDHGEAMVVDGNDVYITGWFGSETADFGTDTLTNVSNPK